MTVRHHVRTTQSAAARGLTATLFAALVVSGCSDGGPAGPAAPSATVSAPATPASTTTPQAGCSQPPAPTDLRVMSQQGAVVEIGWRAVPNATGYTVLVGSRPGLADVLDANTSQNAFRFTARDGRQFARVQAHTSCGGGPTSGYLQIDVVL